MSVRPKPRVVLDTNVMVRMTLTRGGVASALKAAAEERHFVTLLSEALVDEYRATLSSSDLTKRFPHIDAEGVNSAIAKLWYVAEKVRPVRAHFDLVRDPDDAKLLELAIDGAATHLVTVDKDLLSLPNARGEAGRRFRQRLRTLRVMEPNAFLEDLASGIGRN